MNIFIKTHQIVYLKLGKFYLNNVDQLKGDREEEEKEQELFKNHLQRLSLVLPIHRVNSSSKSN